MCLFPLLKYEPLKPKGLTVFNISQLQNWLFQILKEKLLLLSEMG